MRKNNHSLVPYTHSLFHTVTLLISLCLLFVSNPLFAKESLTGAANTAELQVKVSLQERAKIVPNQQITLNVDLLSEGAFNGTVKIAYLDINNAIVIQPDGQTEIKTQEIDGKKWFILREKITLYPRKAGTFSVPEITLNITFNNQQQGNTTTKIKSQPYQFEVSDPDALKGIKEAIASPHIGFTLSQTGQKKEGSYQVGDAITYVYETQAQKMHALLLSELTINDINAVQMYRKPVVKKDDFDRFEKFNTASIKQEITFIFEKEGAFTLPEQRLVWWNSNKGELQETVIKAQTIIVGGGASFLSQLTPLNQFKLSTSSTLLWLVMLLFTVLLLLGIWQLNRHKQHLLTTFHKVNKTQQKQRHKKLFEVY